MVAFNYPQKSNYNYLTHGNFISFEYGNSRSKYSAISFSPNVYVSRAKKKNQEIKKA